MVQVVLSQTIKGIGNKGELVLVAVAYAENVVVRGGLGVIASPEILADQKRFKGTALRSAGARPRMVLRQYEERRVVHGTNRSLP